MKLLLTGLTTILLCSTHVITAGPAISQAKPAEATQEQKLAVVAAIKSIQEVVQATTKRSNKEKFGIGQMIAEFRKEAKNDKNPQQAIFKKDLEIGEQLLTLSDKDFTKAKELIQKLSPETQKQLQTAMEQYNLMTRLGAIKEFLNARTVPA